MLRLIFVNVVFAALLALFIIMPITNNWAWLTMITSWCVAEAFLSRDKRITWWQWSLVFISLGIVDLVIITYSDYLF